MATGQRAFAGDSAAAHAGAVMREQPRAPSEVAPDVRGTWSGHPPLPAQGGRPALPEHGRREAGARADQGGLGLTAGRGVRSRPAPTSSLRHGPGSRRRPLVRCGELARSAQHAHPASPLHSSCRSRTLSGWVWFPTFSPDGEQVAFSLDGGTLEYDIYVKWVGSSEVHRLTTDLAQDYAPSWSPDGRQIAFVRESVGEGTIHLVSPLGGPGPAG